MKTRRALGGVLLLAVLAGIFLITREDDDVLCGGIVCGKQSTCSGGLCICKPGHRGDDCQAQDPWLALAYGYAVDPGEPYSVAKKTVLFDISSDDVALSPERSVTGHTVYSTTENTAAEQFASEMGVHGQYGAFSAAASMDVSGSTDVSIKTARLDVFVQANRKQAIAVGTFATRPHTKLTASIRGYIDSVDVLDVLDIASELGVFFTTSAYLGGSVQKTYTMQMVRTDTRSSIEDSVKARYNDDMIGGDASFGETHSTRTDVQGAQMSTSFTAKGGNVNLWLTVEADGSNFQEVQTEWANSFAEDGHDLYPCKLQLVPIWELVERIDAEKGQALRDALTRQWTGQIPTPPTEFFEGVDCSSVCGEHSAAPSSAVAVDVESCSCGHCSDNFVGERCDFPPKYNVRGSSTGIDGLYTRSSDRKCNGKPVYELAVWGGLSSYVLFQPAGGEGWWVSGGDDAEACYSDGWLNSNMCRTPDQCDFWEENTDETWSSTSSVEMIPTGF
jgi:hypothetical protein